MIEADIRRPKYFSPSEAVEYGIIDKVPFYKRNIPPFKHPPAQENDKEKEKATLSKIKYCNHISLTCVFLMTAIQVLYNEKSPEDRGLVTELKASRLM